MNRQTILVSAISALMAGAGPAVSPLGAQQVMVTTSVGPGSGPGMGMSMIPHRSLEDYSSLLRLDDTQRDVVEMMYEGYADAHRAATEAFQSQMQALQEEFQNSNDFAVYEDKMPKLFEESGERIDELEGRFLDDVRVVLTEDQLERWPRVERARRRATLLPGLGFMVRGANVDLFEVARASGMDPYMDDAVLAMLEPYETELDRVVSDLERMGERARDDLRGGGEPDFAKVQELMGDMRENSVRLRDLSRRHVRLIAGQLDADRGGRFEQEYLSRAFPRVYRASHAAKMLGAARGFSDLSEDQRQTLETIAQSYERELASANQRWLDAILAGDENDEGGFMGQVIHLAGGAEEQDTPEAKAKADRKGLDSRTEDKIIAALNQGQRDRLPAREPEQPEFGWGQLHVDEDVIEEDGAGGVRRSVIIRSGNE